MRPARKLLVVGSAAWLGEVRFVLRSSFCSMGRSFSVTEAETVDKALDILSLERFDCVLYANGAKGWSELQEASWVKNMPVSQIFAREPMAEFLERVRMLVRRKRGPTKGYKYAPKNKESIEAKEAA
jgi:hypothetical protein